MWQYFSTIFNNCCKKVSFADFRILMLWINFFFYFILFFFSLSNSKKRTSEQKNRISTIQKSSVKAALCLPLKGLYVKFTKYDHKVNRGHGPRIWTLFQILKEIKNWGRACEVQTCWRPVRGQQGWKIVQLSCPES